MSITIEQVLAKTDKGVQVLLRHAGQHLRAEVAASSDQASAALGQSLTVELGFAAVLSWSVLRGESEREHGLFQDHRTLGIVRIVGDVHNILQLDDGGALFDVYLRAGPEFVTFESKDLPGHAPQLRESLEVTVEGLCFYPTWT
jgi:hypothetical protein